MLSSFDDFPVHQTSRPIAQTVVGRPEPLRPLLLQRLHPRCPAVLRRRDGAVPEPPRRRRGVQRRGRRWHASTAGRSTCTPRDGRRPIAPTPTRSARSRSRCSSRSTRCGSQVDAPEHGLRADLTFVRRSAPIEEPHFLHQVGVRVMFDYTRLTQFGGWEGWIEVDGELYRPRTRRDVGITRPLVGHASGRRTRPSGRPGRRPAVLLAVGTGQLRDVLDPLRRQRAVRRPALARDGRRRPGRHGRRRAPRGDACRWTTASSGRPAPGTRRRSNSISSPWVGEPSTIRLEPLFDFQMLGIGYGHPEWAHGVWKGELVVGGDRWDLPIDDPTAPRARTHPGDRAGDDRRAASASTRASASSSNSPSVATSPPASRASSTADSAS